jgi:YD repeat-containing protein
VLGTIDPNGVVTTNLYDVFFRPTEKWVNSTAYAAASSSLWRVKYSYNLGGVSSGLSYNYARTRLYDPNDTVNGIETYGYTDGLGRTIQTRVESETNNVYRVSDVFYDASGRPFITTQPYFSAGSANALFTGTKVVSLTEYDPIGRAFRFTPITNLTFNGSYCVLSALTQDSGSPTAPSTIAFSDSNNPWITVATDAEGKVTKTYRDEFGRTIQISSIFNGGSTNTTFGYDLVGNLTNVVNANGKVTSVYYNSAGAKTATQDPDMGLWTYGYDLAGRLVEQVDAKAQKVQFQ